MGPSNPLPTGPAAAPSTRAGSLGLSNQPTPSSRRADRLLLTACVGCLGLSAARDSSDAHP